MPRPNEGDPAEGSPPVGCLPRDGEPWEVEAFRHPAAHSKIQEGRGPGCKPCHRGLLPAAPWPPADLRGPSRGRSSRPAVSRARPVPLPARLPGVPLRLAGQERAPAWPCSARARLGSRPRLPRSSRRWPCCLRARASRCPACSSRAPLAAWPPTAFRDAPWAPGRSRPASPGCGGGLLERNVPAARGEQRDLLGLGGFVRASVALLEGRDLLFWARTAQNAWPVPSCALVFPEARARFARLIAPGGG